MDENVSGSLRLDDLQFLAQISEGKAKHLKDACIWALLFCEHTNGVKIRVVSDNVTVYHNINWLENHIDVEALNRGYNQDDAAEFGAEAIAILLSMVRTEYDTIERSSTATGIDYWLGFKNRRPNEPFHRAGRLEISGIMKETSSNKVSARVKEKLKQTKLTDHTFPVYVIVVEFSQPYATMVLKK
jgi:hypothetical protein